MNKEFPILITRKELIKHDRETAKAIFEDLETEFTIADKRNFNRIKKKWCDSE